ncbi:MAG: IS256 family transposase, partial [Anaerolineae bacterium]
TDPTMALMEYLSKFGLQIEDDFVREGIRVLIQSVIEVEVTQRIDAERYERSSERVTQRNGYRERRCETRVGELTLQVLKLREGSYFPSFLEPRRKAEKALLAVVQRAYVEGVSTRRVDNLLHSLGLTGIDKSKVSRICEALDEPVRAFRGRALSGDYPYVWLDATYLKVRQNHHIVSMAMVVAIGVRETGEREVLGFAVGASEEASFWLEFLRSLVRRGLRGVRLVVSDAHEGLKAALGQVLSGAAWQRCRVHFMRNVLAHVTRADKTVVAAALRTIFAQPDRASAGQQLELVAETMAPRWPKAAELLRAAEEDVLAYMAFPSEHWTRIYSTNPLERLNKEIKRRTNVVGIFPDVPSLERLVSAILTDIHDEWQVGRRYFSQESMRKLLTPEEQLRITAPLHLEPIR